MRYDINISERRNKFFFRFDAFLFICAVCSLFLLLIEYGHFELHVQLKNTFSIINFSLFVLLVLELILKIGLSSLKTRFIKRHFAESVLSLLLLISFGSILYFSFFSSALRGFQLGDLANIDFIDVRIFRVLLTANLLLKLTFFKRLVTQFKVLPAQILVLGFFGIIFIGTILLTLPIASANHTSQSIIDALFTVISAVSTTGLIVVDTGSYYSLFGQSVMLTLIQIGGLGYMVFVVLIILGWGGGISFTTKNLLHESLGQISHVDIKKFSISIVIFALLFEIVGGILLTYFWKDYFPLSKAIYISIFHSISAFCTAGFSTFQDSFVSYQSNIYINIVLILTFMGGAIGFLVLYDFWIYFIKFIRRKHPRRILVHSKFILLIFIILIVLGTGIVFTFEKGFYALSFDKRLLYSFFQITSAASTTGFNSVDVGAMAPPSLFTIIILMFIGAAPGSTAGGIKLTTFGVMLLFSYSVLRTREDVNIFGRRIPFETIKKAFTITFISIVWINLSIVILTITEKASFLQIIFEAVSASGTVGLSMGITPNLSTMGKIIICINMFIGRIGPLMIGASLIGKPKPLPFKYPDEDMLVG